MNRQKIACNCKNITYGMIEDVIKAGAKNYEDVEKQLRFGTGCGKCKEFIRFLTIRFGISLKPIQSVDQSDLP